MSRTGTVALVVRVEAGSPILLDQISDDHEIEILEHSLHAGGTRALEDVYSERDRQMEEEERFGDFVEALITQPFVKQELLEHGVQWLKAKVKIEKYHRQERDATRVIAQYAFQVYSENPGLTDFMLSGPHAQVRIRILELPQQGVQESA
jgi:hypothetical protein